MKKILILAVSLFMFGSSIQAQHTIPRYGTAASQDNTFRNQKLGYVRFTDAAGADTLQVNVSSLKTYVNLTVTDAVNIYAPSASAYVGDELTFLISNTSGSGHTVAFFGRAGVASPWQVGSGGVTITLTTAKQASITFVFFGGYWVEKCRLVQ